MINMSTIADVVAVAMRNRAANYRDGAFGRILAAGYDRLNEFRGLRGRARKDAMIRWVTAAIHAEELAD